MAKKVLIFIVLSIILIIIFVKLSERLNFEKDYQEGIKRISDGRYHDAGVSLVRAHKADYKHSTALYYYAEAMQADSHMYEYYLNKIPSDYNGPLAERILALKRGDPEALIAREEYRKGRFKETVPTPKPAPLPPPPGMPTEERKQVVHDQDKKENDYLEKLESILRDVRYSSSASDSYRAERKLRDLREEMMNDPKIGVNELRKLDQAIDAVRAMRR